MPKQRNQPGSKRQALQVHSAESRHMADARGLDRGCEGARARMSVGGRWQLLVRSQTPRISGRGGPGRPGNHSKKRDSKRRDLSMFPGPCPGYYVFCTLVVFSQAVPHVSGKRWPCGFARARRTTRGQAAQRANDPRREPRLTPRALRHSQNRMRGPACPHIRKKRQRPAQNCHKKPQYAGHHSTTHAGAATSNRSCWIDCRSMSKCSWTAACCA